MGNIVHTQSRKLVEVEGLLNIQKNLTRNNKKYVIKNLLIMISSLKKIRNDAKLFCEKNHPKWHLTYLSAMFGNYFFCNCSYLFVNLFKMPVCIYGLLEISIFVFYDWCVNF